MARVDANEPLSKRVISFVDEMIDELEGDFLTAGQQIYGEEIIMWKALLRRKQHFSKKARMFIQNRIRVLEKTVKINNAEIKLWKEIKRAMNPCKDCDGAGGFAETIDQDETRRTTCERCKGSGTEPE